MIKDKEKQKEHARKHYLANKEKVKKRAKKFTEKAIERNRVFIKGHLSKNPCIDCGFSDIRALDFDHIRDKIMPVSEMAYNGSSIERLKKEIDKCEIRCANCHRIKTSERLEEKKVKNESTIQVQTIVPKSSK